MSRHEREGVPRRSVLRSLGLVGGGALGLNLATTDSYAAHIGGGRRNGSHGGGGSCGGGGDGSSPRPGPDVLYEDPVTTPKLAPEGRWRADPLLVCGADAHVDGEYVFQSFIYDDNGANTSPTIDPPDPRPTDHTFGPMTGDVVYPTEFETYGYNAADLLEFRAQPQGDGVSYRIALNTMKEPDAAAVAIGIDTDAGDGDGTSEWGYGIGDLGDLDLDHVLVTWGAGAELNGDRLDDSRVSVDADRNQIEVDVDLDPDGETWRHYLVTGLWDPDAGEFKQIQDQPDQQNPGGARGQDPPPVFNVGFRFNDQEPLATPNIKPESAEREIEEAVEEATGSRAVGYGHWRDHAQAKALADGDISEFYADVDFGALRRNEDRFRVPETGFFNRLYVSRYDLGEGIRPIEGWSRGADVLRNDIVPYALYVPEGYDSSESTPFHVHLHSLTATCNQYASWTPNFLEDLGDGEGRIIMTPSGRGPVVPYHDQAELDVFEAMADVRARYSVDLDRTTLGGYSNGGIGTFKLASQYPDLFSRAFPIVGAVGDENTQDVYYDLETLADNLRSVPLRMWSSVADELVPFPLVLKFERRLRELGWRHELDIFPEDHLSFGYFDQWDPAIDFLTTDPERETNPQRVRYRAVPEFDNEELDLVHDGAHWVQDIVVADGQRSGVVDARSQAFGEPLPVREEFERPGQEPRPHHKRIVEWAEDFRNPSPPPRNVLELELEDVTHVAVHVDAAALDPGQPIELRIDADLADGDEATIELRSSAGTETVTVGDGETTRSVTIC
jgi:pimeloyl-ACP methyl ester carboxylesterase